MSKLIPINKEVTFEYTSYDLVSSLSVAMKVYDVTAGFPGTLVATVAMTHVVNGAYAAKYTFPTTGKQYLVSKMVYTNGTFVTPSNKYSPGSETLLTHDLDERVAQLQLDITAIRAKTDANLDATVSSRATQTSVDGIQNNTTFVGVVPATLVLPESGTKPYRIFANLFDTLGNPEDADGAMNIRIEDNTGSVVVATQAMTHDGTGRWHFDYTVNASDPERGLRVFFEYAEAGVSFQQVRVTEVQEFESKLSLLLSRLTASRATNLDNLDAAISSRQSSSTALTQHNDVLSAVTGLSPAIADLDSDVAAFRSAMQNEHDVTQAAIAALEVDLDSQDLGLIADAVWNEARAEHTSNGSFGAALQGVLSTSRADAMDAILLTNATVNSITSKLGSPVTTVAGDLAAIKSDSAAIKAKTDQFSFTGGNVHSHVVVSVDKAGYALSSAQSSALVAAIWDEPLAAHAASGSMGDALADAQASVSPAVIADAVWDEARAGHVAVGSFGEAHQGVISTVRANNLDKLDVATSTLESVAAASAALTALQTNINDNEAKLDSILGVIGSPAGPTIAADLASIQNQANKIGTPPTGTLGGALSDILADTVVIGTPAGASVVADIAAVMARLGLPSGATISADIASIKADSNKIGSPTGTLASDIAALSLKVGTPAGASVSADLATIQGTVNATSAKIGTPAGASIAADIASVKTDAGTLVSRLTVTRAAFLDNLDVPVSSRESESDASDRFANESTDHAAILAAVGAVPNNTTFVGIVPSVLVLPAAGSKSYKFYVNLFNNDGSPGDPDASMNVRIEDVNGNIIVGNTAMTHPATGQFSFSYAVNAIDPERTLYVIFEYSKGGTAYKHVRIAEVQEFESKLDTLISRITPTRASNLDNLDALVSTRQSAATALVQTTALQTSLTDLDAGIDALAAKLGSPVNGSVSADISAVLGAAAKIGSPTNGTIANDLSAITAMTNKIGTPTYGTLALDHAQILARLGTPIVTLAADLASVKADSIKVGSPVGASLSADVAEIRAKLGVLASTDLESKDNAIIALINSLFTMVGFPVTSISADIAALSTKLGNPAGLSMATDLASIKADSSKIGTPSGASLAADVLSVFNRLGAPAGASIAADLVAIAANAADIAVAATGIMNIESLIGSPVVTVSNDLAAVKDLLGSGIQGSLLYDNDARLNYLDAAISTRATPADVGGGGGSGSIGQDLTAVLLDDDSGVLVGVLED